MGLLWWSSSWCCNYLKSKVYVFKREKVRQCLIVRWFQKLVLFSVITCALYLPLMMSSNLQTCPRQDWSRLCCKSQLSSLAKSFSSQILKISSNLNISEDFNFTYPTKKTYICKNCNQRFFYLHAAWVSVSEGHNCCQEGWMRIWEKGSSKKCSNISRCRKQIAGLALGWISHWHHTQDFSLTTHQPKGFSLATYHTKGLQDWNITSWAATLMEKLNYFKTKKGKPDNKPAVHLCQNWRRTKKINLQFSCLGV